MLLQNPLGEPVLILVSGRYQCLVCRSTGLVPVIFDTGQSGQWAERSAAGLALVAIGILVAAVRASAGDVAVGQKLLCLLVVILVRSFLHKDALVVERLEESGGHLGMGFEVVRE